MNLSFIPFFLLSILEFLHYNICQPVSGFSSLIFTGIVTDGGARPNIIPRTAALEYYIRTPKNRNLKKLEKMLKNCVDGAALATDCDVCTTCILPYYY